MVEVWNFSNFLSESEISSETLKNSIDPKFSSFENLLTYSKRAEHATSSFDYIFFDLMTGKVILATKKQWNVLEGASTHPH